MKVFLIFISVCLVSFGSVDGGLLDGTLSSLKTAADKLLSNLPTNFLEHLEKFDLLENFLNAAEDVRNKMLNCFLENDKKILDAILGKGPNGFELGHNIFSTICPEEFNRQRLRLVVPPSITEGASSSETTNSRRRRAATTTPASADWRNTGAVTPVKDQGQCGSCWAFSATGAIVGAWYAKYGKSINISEQNLMDCVTKGCNGCNGGWMVDAYNWVTSNGGVDSDPAYGPYAAAVKTCRYTVANRGANVTSAVNLPKGDEVALAAAVAKQPIAVAIDATKLQNYKSGIYSCTGNVTLNHGVLVVGYGNINGTDTWIVKNSWGANWAYQGYFYVKRNANNTCGVATAGNYPVV